MAVFPQEDREHVLIASATMTDFQHWSDLQDRHTLRMSLTKRMPKLWKALFEMSDRLGKTKDMPKAPDLMRMSGFAFGDRYILPSMGIDLRNIEILGAIVCESTRAKGFRLLLFLDESIYAFWGKEFAIGIVEIPLPDRWNDREGFFLSNRDRDIAAQLVDYSFGKASYGERHEQLSDLTKLYDLRLVSNPQAMIELGEDGNGFKHIQLGVGHMEPVEPVRFQDAPRGNHSEPEVPMGGTDIPPQQKMPNASFEIETSEPPAMSNQIAGDRPYASDSGGESDEDLYFEDDSGDHMETRRVSSSEIPTGSSHTASQDDDDEEDGFSDYENDLADANESVDAMTEQGNPVASGQDGFQSVAPRESNDDGGSMGPMGPGNPQGTNSVATMPSIDEEQDDGESDFDDYDDSIGSFHRPSDWEAIPTMVASKEPGATLSQQGHDEAETSRSSVQEARSVTTRADVVIGIANEMALTKIGTLLDLAGRISNAIGGKSHVSQSEEHVPMAFALVCQSIVRHGNAMPSPEQVEQAFQMHEGKPVSAGEDRQVPILMVAFLEALCGHQTHVMTTDEQLIVGASSYASEALGDFGITVTRGTEAPSDGDRYESDIIFGTPDMFGSDYLMNSLSDESARRAWMRLDFAIVDGATSILERGGNTPFSVKGASSISEGNDYHILADIVRNLQYSLSPDDTTCDIAIDMRRKKIFIRADGASKLKARVRRSDLQSDYQPAELTKRLQCALQAEYLLKRGVDYIVSGNGIVLRDPRTGMLLPGRKWSGGLHQAVEAKEGLPVHEEGNQIASMTVSEYIRLYDHIAKLN